MTRVKSLPVQAYPNEMRAAMTALRPTDSQRQRMTTKDRPRLNVLLTLPTGCSRGASVARSHNSRSAVRLTAGVQIDQHATEDEQWNQSTN
jgi:hypothetical protein